MPKNKYMFLCIIKSKMIILRADKAAVAKAEQIVATQGKNLNMLEQSGFFMYVLYVLFFLTLMTSNTLGIDFRFPMLYLLYTFINH